jgi:prophage antirepressor-like protein
MLRLIVGSKLPAAERFKRWVFEEVLPSIRKTGSYADPQALGALGVCAQPLPFLIHVADFHGVADRVFRAVLPSARIAGLPLPQALRRANAVTQAQTSMDVLAVLNADDHLLALEAQASVAPARQHVSAARFWQEWMAGGIDGLPYRRAWPLRPTKPMLTGAP